MTSGAATAKRDRTFDIMKGIGILLMITAHFFNWNHPVLGRCINSFHMPMFFIVAGYFSKSFSSWDNIVPQVKKYASRLLPAALFTQVTLILWSVLLALTNKGGWDPVIQQTLSIFWADPHGPMTPWGPLYIGVIWFLLALLISKSLLLILSRLNGWSIPISLLLAFGSILLYRFFPYSIWCVSLGLTALPFVTIGWWLKTHPIPWWFVATCVLCWFLSIAYSELNMYGFIWKCFPLDVLGALGGTFCLYGISIVLDRYIDPLATLFSFIGILSLAIMCFHDIEINSRLTNHLLAFSPFPVPLWGKYVVRYILPIVLGAIAVRTPILKKVFI